MNQRKTIAEPAPPPADAPEPVTAIEAMIEVLVSLRDSGGPLLRPGVHSPRDVADAVLSGLTNLGFEVIPDQK